MLCYSFLVPLFDLMEASYSKLHSCITPLLLVHKQPRCSPSKRWSETAPKRDISRVVVELVMKEQYHPVNTKAQNMCYFARLFNGLYLLFIFISRFVSLKPKLPQRLFFYCIAV